MRAFGVATLATAIFAVAASGQSGPDTVRRAPMDARLRTELMVLRTLFGSVHAPVADSFRLGNQEVPAGVAHQGTMAVARGDLSVRGRIIGDAIAVHGDVVVYPGATVTGNAISVDGRVRSVGGVVEGDVRSIRGITGNLLARAAGRDAGREATTPWAAIKLVIAWFAILTAIGIGILLFAEKNLNEVVGVLEQQFTRAFWTGILAQLAAIPALLLVVVALAVTILGILLIPFAVVAFVIALCGLMTLGFIAVARFTGRAFFRSSAQSRAVHLRSLFSGLLLYLGLWFIAAALVWSPVAGSVTHAVALAGSWVAITFGLGATILSRAGTRRDHMARRSPQADELSWQTPTPVTGVAAARRPVVTTKES